MASSQLSPRKYIETKARTLPIYKCLVNKDWKEISEANVVVMRRHVNGNVTAGFFLVDLLCLGVRDTFYTFNEPEEELKERIADSFDAEFEEVSYNLVHNIIFAGFDFAADFGIDANKDFAITRFVLEEDTEDIPLINVKVGDENGLPHLVVHEPGEHSKALASLQKHAGEGKFRYTISGYTNDDFDSEDDYVEGELLEHYPPGTLMPIDAQVLADEELEEEDKINGRTTTEKLILKVEQALRTLRKAQPALFGPDIEDSEEYEWIDDSESIAFGITMDEEETFVHSIEPLILSAINDTDVEKRTAVLGELLEQHADKLLVVSAVFEAECNRQGNMLATAKKHLESLHHFPLSMLDLALADMLYPERYRQVSNMFSMSRISGK